MIVSGRLKRIFLYGILSWFISMPVGFERRAMAAGGVPSLLPFDGRLTDTNGAAITTSTVVNFRIYPPTGSCFIYEDTQTIIPNSSGLFSVTIGDSSHTSGPANAFTNIFSNESSLSLATSCLGTNYSPAANDLRRLEIVVAGVPLTGMQTIGSSAFALNSNMLDGKTSAAYIQTSPNVTQANVEGLTNSTDASGLHHHDGRYLKIDGTTSMTGALSTSNNVLATGATSKVGIGTATPSVDLEISRTNPTIMLKATSGGSGQMQLDFNSGATARGAIKANENANGLQFFSGSTQAMSLDPIGNLILTGSLSIAGTAGLGKYTDAQETTMIASLTAGSVGTVWANTTSKVIKYWDGTAVKVLASGSSFVNSVTAGTGLSNSGTATDPVLNIAYGTSANTALQGNQAFSGDVSGTISALSVDKIKGVGVDFTSAPTTGQVLTLNGSGNWIAANPAPTGISSLNALSGSSQTFANGSAGTAPAFSSVGSTHTLNIPLASTGGVTAGLISNADYANLAAVSGKVAKAGDTMTGILTLSADPTASLDASTKQYVDAGLVTLGSAYIKKDGTVAFTGDQSMGTHKLTNVVDPAAAQDAATKNYVDTKSAAGDLTGTLGAATVAKIQNISVDVTGLSNGQVLSYNSGLNKWAPANLSSGAVTSVNMSLPAEFSVSGGPVTSSGTLTGAWATQTTNKVFAAPNGSTGVPTFRALTAADISGGSAGNVLYNNAGTWSAGTPDTAGLVDKTNTQTIGGNKTFSGSTVLGVTSLGATTHAGNTTASVSTTHDYSASTSFKLPVSAGAAPTVSGLIAYDSTANAFKIGVNGTSYSVVKADSSGNVGIGTSSPGTALDVVGSLRLENGANTATFSAPASGGAKSYVLPTSSGVNGQALVTDGTGNLTWQDNGGGATTQWTTTGSDIYFSAGKVGINQASPGATLDVNGHVANSATGTPTVSSCGTTPAITGNDTRGVVTFGTGSPAACTLTFASAFATTPYCVVSGASTTTNRFYVTASSTTAITVTQSTATSSTKFNYICMQ